MNGDVGWDSAITDESRLLLSNWKVNVVLADKDNVVFTDSLLTKGKLLFHADAKTVQQALMTKQVWGITGLEFASSREGMHHPHSSFNQVLAKLAVQHKKRVVFLLSAFLEVDRDTKAVVLARLSQNIMLCRKYGVSWYLWSGATHPLGWVSPISRMAFARVLGASSEQAKKAVDEIEV